MKTKLFLRNLILRNFRKYQETLVQFEPSLNKIVGPNAHGKTTLLEAIQFLINGKSFRTSATAELVRHGENHFFIEANFIKQGIEQTLKISYLEGERKILYNNTVYHSSANLLGLLQGVVATPDDVSLIKGSPTQRRHFLDLQIAQIDPLYVHYVTRYAKAMRQRNALLKSKNLQTIEHWEEEMGTSAAYISLQRKEAIKDLGQLINESHALLVDQKDPISLDYKHSFMQNESLSDIKNHYKKIWHRSRNREKEIGITLAGPHRDDFYIKIAEKEAKLFASEGQQRSCVIALKLSEWQRLYRLSEEMPLMLIDDVGIGLDHRRKERLLTHLSSLGQVFTTSTD